MPSCNTMLAHGPQSSAEPKRLRRRSSPGWYRLYGTGPAWQDVPDSSARRHPAPAGRQGGYRRFLFARWHSIDICPAGHSLRQGRGDDRKGDGGSARKLAEYSAWPRLVIKILAGLMSRCIIPSPCAASSASAISIARGSSVSISSARPRSDALTSLSLEIPSRATLPNLIDGADILG
jgi:hypothetical protein